MRPASKPDCREVLQRKDGANVAGGPMAPQPEIAKVAKRAQDNVRLEKTEGSLHTVWRGFANDFRTFTLLNPGGIPLNDFVEEATCS
jgi:hypothetical protein